MKYFVHIVIVTLNSTKVETYFKECNNEDDAANYAHTIIASNAFKQDCIEIPCINNFDDNALCMYSGDKTKVVTAIVTTYE